MNEQITPKLEQAVMRTLYHHSFTTPAIVQMLTGARFEESLPPPTIEEREQAAEIVEALIRKYKECFGAACQEVIGEDPFLD